MKKLLISLLFAGIIGCGGDDNNQEPADIQNQDSSPPAISDTSVIMPLTIGNYWIYQIAVFDTVANDYVIARIDTFLVTGDTMIDNEKWYFVHNMTPEGGRVINREDGLWQYREGVEPFLFLKFPVSDGAEFMTQIGPTEVFNRINGVSEEVDTPAGKFACYKYTHILRQRNLVVDFYFQPGIGGIRMDISMNEGLQPMTRQDLIEYKLQ